MVTDRIDGVHRESPILRDPDSYTYIKEEVGGLLVGGFEPEAKPWVAPDALPYPFEFQLLEEDWDHFAILMDSAITRIPALTETGIKMFYSSPELATARPFRHSPAYHLLEQASACFGSRMGWERANFFAPAGRMPVIEYDWGQQNWQPWSCAEQRAARTSVALFDQTSFSRYLVTGRDAEQVLQWLCTADVAVEPGRTVYTGRGAGR